MYRGKPQAKADRIRDIGGLVFRDMRVDCHLRFTAAAFRLGLRCGLTIKWEILVCRLQSSRPTRDEHEDYRIKALPWRCRHRFGLEPGSGASDGFDLDGSQFECLGSRDELVHRRVPQQRD